MKTVLKNSHLFFSPEGDDMKIDRKVSPFFFFLHSFIFHLLLSAFSIFGLFYMAWRRP